MKLNQFQLVTSATSTLAGIKLNLSEPITRLTCRSALGYPTADPYCVTPLSHRSLEFVFCLRPDDRDRLFARPTAVKQKLGSERLTRVRIVVGQLAAAVRTFEDHGLRPVSKDEGVVPCSGIAPGHIESDRIDHLVGDFDGADRVGHGPKNERQVNNLVHRRQRRAGRGRAGLGAGGRGSRCRLGRRRGRRRREQVQGQRTEELTVGEPGNDDRELTTGPGVVMLDIDRAGRGDIKVDCGSSVPKVVSHPFFGHQRRVASDRGPNVIPLGTGDRADRAGIARRACDKHPSKNGQDQQNDSNKKIQTALHLTPPFWC